MYLQPNLCTLIKKITPYFLPLVFFLVASSNSSQAAHLIGGEVSYTCQGNNLYTVSLRIYRDCAGGGAQFDQTARVAIYDINNALIRTLSIPRGNIVSLNNTLTSDPCVTVPPNLCVEYADYVDTVTLSPILGGYNLVHQRCCRNSIIGNVNNPGSLGNTYSIRIPSMDTTCNSSPQILSPPDNVLCLNRPARVELKVSEADGDSISYDLCQIYAGGGQSGGVGCNAVIPNPPCPPPFTNVPFTAPLSPTNPIPAAQGFSLNPRTGVLTGIANQLGIYVAGICITEWRNGQALSTVRLDYQFAVSNCVQNVVADMKTPIEDPRILCDGLTVQFESETQGASDVLWNFGDLNTNRDTSRSPSPLYTYPAPGTYMVTLVANPGQQCSDTTFAPFTVKAPVNPSFLWDGVPCFEVQNLRFEAQGNLPSNGRYDWIFGGDALTPRFSGPRVFGLSWASPGDKPVTLRVSWDSCSIDYTDTITITDDVVFVEAGPDTIIKRGENLQLSASAARSYYWYASSPVKFDNPFARSPEIILRPEDDSVMFWVQVTDAFGCTGRDSLWVYVDNDLNENIYNIITPNGDGKNDFLDISKIDPSQSCNLIVYNRWGSEVYRARPYAGGFDGRDQNGQELPDGTYYYVVQCENRVQATGPVTVIRYQ